MTATVSVCPSAVVEAPIERVWDLLTSPEGVNSWVDAVVLAAEPDGPFVAGQRLDLVTRALAHNFAISIDVLEVDLASYRLRLLIRLPLGIVNDELITLAVAGEDRTFVQFG
jgi:hypothetical protein